MVKKKWKINWSSEKVMSVSALFISVISLVALLYQSYLGREENRLIQKQQSASVLPHLSQWFSNNENSFKFVVGNKGVGPAFIDNVEIVLDSTHRFDNTKDLFFHIFKTTKGLDTIPYKYSTLIKGFVLPANDQINILELDRVNNINFFLKALEKKQILYKIYYSDVYGTRWYLSNKNDTNVPVLISRNH